MLSSTDTPVTTRPASELASELVRLKVDVITTAGDLSTRAAQRATTTTPIVALLGLPVEADSPRVSPARGAMSLASP